MALSFAGAQRPYVEQVAAALKAQGVRAFYDADEQIDLWGKYLSEELPAVYSGLAATVVVFVSAQYAAQDWTILERRAALGRAVRERREYVLPARFDDTELPGLLPDMVTVDLRGLAPEEFAARVATKLALLGIIHQDGTTAGGEAPDAWDVPSRRSVGPGQPVEQLDDPFALEVHPAIDAGAQGAGLPALPAYVPRDHDGQMQEVIRRVVGGSSAVAVLVGGSSTGKTRACWEAVKTLPAGWRLWHPISPGRPEAALAELPRIGPRTVVWLNEAQHYLLVPSAEIGERVAAGLRELLRDPRRRPVLVLATVWPDYWAALATTPADGQPDPHAQARALLTGAAISVPNAFTGPALAALHAAGRGDPRLAEAQVHAEQGQVTQYLAGAPALLERYRTAPLAAKALIEAAMDARRLGHSPALPHALLEAAAPGYLTDQQWDALGEDWLDRALAYTAVPCRGARGPLTRIRPRPGQPGYDQPHYRLADYLEQHGRTTRRAYRAPAGLWGAMVAHAAADAARLAGSADDRLLYRYATPLYRRAAEAGDGHAVSWLVERGDADGAIEVLRASADAGNESAANLLAGLLAERGDADGLRARADAGDGHAALYWADLLVERGDADGLRARAEAGNENAAHQWARLLVERGYAEGAIEVLRARADMSDESAANLLAGVLAERGDADGLRARADIGDKIAASWLAGLLAERGDADGLRARADAGDGYAALRLADLLAKRGDADGLRARADAGNKSAAHRLARLLVERGDADGAIEVLGAHADAGHGDVDLWLTDLLVDRDDLEEAIQILRVRADAGNKIAASWLADLLAKRGDADGLRARADAGDGYAAHRLARLLVERGDADGAIEVLRARADVGDGIAGSWLASLLADRGEVNGAIEVLGAHADADDVNVAYRLANLLVERGDTNGLRARSEAGDGYAAHRLARLLVERGDTDGAIEVLGAHADAGNDGVDLWLTDLLVERGDTDGLRARAEAGDGHAAYRLADLLADRGDADGAIEVLRARAEAGDGHAAYRLADLLADRGDADGLRARAATGDRHAAHGLAGVLARLGRGEDAERVRRFGLNPDGSIASGPDG